MRHLGSRMTEFLLTACALALSFIAYAVWRISQEIRRAHHFEGEVIGSLTWESAAEEMRHRHDD